MNRLDFQALLQARFPGDYSAAWALLAEHETESRTGETEEHHICPRKQFPEYEFGYPGNLIHLPIASHHLVHEHYGKANTALIVNSRWLSAGSLLALKVKGAKAAAAVCKKNGTGIYSEAVRKKARDAQRKNGTGFYDPEVQRRGGQALSAKQLGICDPKNRAKVLATCKEKGTGFFNPETSRKGRQTQIEKSIGIFSQEWRAANKKRMEARCLQRALAALSDSREIVC